MFRVLIADDEPIERLAVSKKIQKHFQDCLEVVQAENGEDAVRLFVEEKCDIAILDINMPGMDGLDAAQKIREADGNCSIIFLTAYDEFGYAKRAFSVRALDYLLKPSSDEELIAVLEEAMSLAGRGNVRAGVDDRPSPRAGAEEHVNDNLRIQAVADVIRTYIQENYTRDISLQDIAGSLHYSDAYFSKIFKQCFGKNFTVYLTEYRVDEAKKLLADISVSIKDVGERLGFHDANYFSRVFKRITGKTPSEYRDTHAGMERAGV